MGRKGLCGLSQSIERNQGRKLGLLAYSLAFIQRTFCLFEAESRFVALDWLGTYADQDALGLRRIPASASQMLGLK